MNEVKEKFEGLKKIHEEILRHNEILKKLNASFGSRVAYSIVVILILSFIIFFVLDLLVIFLVGPEKIEYLGLGALIFLIILSLGTSILLFRFRIKKNINKQQDKLLKLETSLKQEKEAIIKLSPDFIITRFGNIEEFLEKYLIEKEPDIFEISIQNENYPKLYLMSFGGMVFFIILCITIVGIPIALLFSIIDVFRVKRERQVFIDALFEKLNHNLVDPSSIFSFIPQIQPSGLQIAPNIKEISLYNVVKLASFVLREDEKIFLIWEPKELKKGSPRAVITNKRTWIFPGEQRFMKEIQNRHTIGSMDMTQFDVQLQAVWCDYQHHKVISILPFLLQDKSLLFINGKVVLEVGVEEEKEIIALASWMRTIINRPLPESPYCKFCDSDNVVYISSEKMTRGISIMFWRGAVFLGGIVGGLITWAVEEYIVKSQGRKILSGLTVRCDTCKKTWSPE